MRVRAQVFRWLVERPGTSGLDWFVRHYERIQPFRKALKRVAFEIALQHASDEVPVAAFEGRTAPEERWGDLRGEVLSIARQVRAMPSRPRPEVGVVFHYLKREKDKLGRHQRLSATPAQIAHGARFGVWGSEITRQSLALARLLRLEPRFLLLARGLDLASNELAVPTWPAVEAVRRVRAASRVASGELRRAHGLDVPPMRATYHAGEDFAHLAEGLRRVHELVEARLLERGDRIGHGLALGTDPARWVREHPVVEQQREDRLDDLVWELDRAAEGEVELPPRRLERVRDEVRSLAFKLYGEVVDEGALREARRRRNEVADHGFPFLRRGLDALRRSTDEADRLLARYLSDEGVFWRGRVPVEVRVMPGDATLLAELQRWLVARLAALEVTVESCPSSNLVVGDLGAIVDHPSFRLQPRPGAADATPVSLPVSLNTDDPVSFATSLADEYAYVYGALLERGAAAEPSLAWLSARRRDGFRSRFTVRESADDRWLDALAGLEPEGALGDRP